MNEKNENWSEEKSLRRYADPKSHDEFVVKHSPYEDAEAERHRLKNATAGELMGRFNNRRTSILSPAARKRIQEQKDAE